MKAAIVAGTTGLIGSQLLELLLNEKNYDRVIALSRKPLSLSNAKLQNIITDLERLPECASQLKAHDIYCCLGSTMNQAGSKEAFRKVDFDYPVSLATIARNHGARQFLLVSAMGANSKSSIFYNRVKEEVEEAVGKIGFEALHIFQPSLLVGHRKEKRKGERAGQVLMQVLDVLIPKKYKAIESIKVARAMVVLARQERPGRFVHKSDELQSF